MSIYFLKSPELSQSLSVGLSKFDASSNEFARRNKEDMKIYTYEKYSYKLLL